MHTQHTNHPSFRANLTWKKVEDFAEKSAAVKSYKTTARGIQIKWCDESSDDFTEMTDAINAIRAMEEE